MVPWALRCCCPGVLGPLHRDGRLSWERGLFQVLLFRSTPHEWRKHQHPLQREGGSWAQCMLPGPGRIKTRVLSPWLHHCVTLDKTIFSLSPSFFYTEMLITTPYLPGPWEDQMKLSYEKHLLVRRCWNRDQNNNDLNNIDAYFSLI